MLAQPLGSKRESQRPPIFQEIFKNIDDVLWKEARCTTELDYTEQTSWMLFLKYLDLIDYVSVAIAQLGGAAQIYTAFIGFRHTSIADCFVAAAVELSPAHRRSAPKSLPSSRRS